MLCFEHTSAFLHRYDTSQGEQFTCLCGRETTMNQSQHVVCQLVHLWSASLSCAVYNHHEVYKAETRRNGYGVGVSEQTTTMDSEHWAVVRDGGTPSQATKPLGTQ